MEEKLPKAVYSGEMKLGSLTLKVHVLDNGQRIIEEQSMVDFMEWIGRGGLFDVPKEEVDKFAKEFKIWQK